MLAQPLNSAEAAVARWLCDPAQQRDVRRVVYGVIARMLLPAPNYVRQWLLADATLHEDIASETQLTYLALWRAGRVEEGKDAQLLRGVAANTTRTLARREARRCATSCPEDISDLEGGLDANYPDLVDVLDNRAALLRLRAAVEKLPARQREIFVTFLVEGYAKATELHGVNRSTARVTVHRALKSVRDAVRGG